MPIDTKMLATRTHVSTLDRLKANTDNLTVSSKVNIWLAGMLLIAESYKTPENVTAEMQTMINKTVQANGKAYNIDIDFIEHLGDKLRAQYAEVLTSELEARIKAIEGLPMIDRVMSVYKAALNG